MPKPDVLSAPPGEVDFEAVGEADTRRRQLESILRHVSAASVLSTLFAVACAMFLLPEAGPLAVEVWLGFKVLMALPRFGMGQYFLRTGQLPAEPRTQKLLLLSLAVDGLVWGIAGVWGASRDGELAALVLALLGATSSAAALGLQVQLAATAAYVVPILLPTAVAYGLRGDVLGAFGATAAMLLMTHAVITAFNSQRSLRSEILSRLRWEAAVAERGALAREAARVDTMRETLLVRSEFLAKVSHELRSPIQGIVSALDVLEMRSENLEGDDGRLLARIRRSSLLLNTQLRDLLTLAKGEAGQLSVHPEVFEAGAMMEAIAEATADLASAKDLRVRCVLPEEPAFVVADGPRIDQIVTNLVVNAIRYTDEGEVVIKLLPYAADRRELLIEVADTGPGLSAEAQDILDATGGRALSSPRGRESSGLGLTIVRTLTNLLGGTVEVRRNEQRGTLVALRIPAEPAESLGPAAHESQQVLIVDDQADIRDALASVIEELGLACDTAPSAAIAANLLAARRYDAVLLDIEMPGRGGCDLVRDVRTSKGPNRETRLIGMSAGEPADDVRAAFDAWLTKPIRRPALRQALALFDSEFRPSQPGLWGGDA